MKNNKKNKKPKTFDYFVQIGKSDIIVYFILTIVVFLVLLYISYKNDFYFYLIFDLYVLFRAIEKIFVYQDLKKIKKYLEENNIINKLGNIDYWNDRNYFLTDNYMIIKENGKIYAFEYSKIKTIYKETDLELNKHSSYQEYLRVITDEASFLILTYSTVMVSEDYKDIKDYLLNKNPNIKVEKTVKHRKIDIIHYR